MTETQSKDRRTRTQLRDELAVAQRRNPNNLSLVAAGIGVAALGFGLALATHRGGFGGGSEPTGSFSPTATPTTSEAAGQPNRIEGGVQVTAAPTQAEVAQTPQGCNVDTQDLLSNTDSMLKSTINDAPMDTFFHPIAFPEQFKKDGSGQWSWGISLLKSSLSKHVNFDDMGGAGILVARPDLQGTPEVTFCILVDQRYLSQYDYGQRSDGTYGPLTGVQTAMNINSTPGATVTIENLETGEIKVQPPLSSGGDGMWDLGGSDGKYKVTVTGIESKKDTTVRFGPDDRPTAPLYRQPMP